MLKKLWSILFPVLVKDWQEFVRLLKPAQAVSGIIQNTLTSDGFDYFLRVTGKDRQGITVRHRSPLACGLHVGDNVQSYRLLLQAMNLMEEIQASVPLIQPSLHTQRGRLVTSDLVMRIQKALGEQEALRA